jgi:hypothetical protein
MESAAAEFPKAKSPETESPAWRDASAMTAFPLCRSRFGLSPGAKERAESSEEKANMQAQKHPCIPGLDIPIRP